MNCLWTSVNESLRPMGVESRFHPKLRSTTRAVARLHRSTTHALGTRGPRHDVGRTALGHGTIVCRAGDSLPLGAHMPAMGKDAPALGSEPSGLRPQCGRHAIPTQHLAGDLHESRNWYSRRTPLVMMGQGQPVSCDRPGGQSVRARSQR